MTKDQALRIHVAGQALLQTLHPHLSDRGLDTFDRVLNELYDAAGLKHALCDRCDASTPKLIMSEGLCNYCSQGGSE